MGFSGGKLQLANIKEGNRYTEHESTIISINVKCMARAPGLTLQLVRALIPRYSPATPRAYPIPYTIAHPQDSTL
jgi:hypothetical protein